MARHGENIFRRKDGRWEARVRQYHGEGRATYHSLYGKTYMEAKTKKEEYYRTVCEKPGLSGQRLMPFHLLAEAWLSTVRRTVKESSYTRYHRNVHRYLIPKLGGCPMAEINAARLRHFREELLSHGGILGNALSEKTVTDLFSTLKMVLSYASEQGYVAADIGRIRTPRSKKHEVRVIPNAVIHRMEQALLRSKDRICIGILLTLHTGIRSGELCGLRWSDFDFGASTVCIRRTVERIADLDPFSARKTKVVVSEPKTEASRREIPLPKALCRYLKSCRGAAENDYLLTGTDQPSEPHTLYIRYERFLKRNGFENYTFHALRHTFATRGIASGFDAKALSEILGHSDVTTTLRCYVHPSMEQKRKQMENLFNPKIRGQNYGK